MSFLAPYMLWGAVTAAIPIALHLFFRSRYRTVPWAAMKFLLTSIEQTSRRLKFQEILLLAARVAVLVLLALALARPLSSASGISGHGDAVAAVFVIDNSFSMGARDGPVTRLERAKTAALSFIDHLPPHSTVQVIASADRATLLGPRTPSNLDQARQLIQELELSALATDFAPGLVEAAAVLERSKAPNRELYLFSDMQKLGWDQQAATVTRTLQDLHQKTALYLVRCGTRTPQNVAVVGIAPQSGIARPGQRIGFAVLVRNTGTEEVRDLEVALSVDGGKDRDTQALARIGPGETRALTLAGKLERAGLRVVTATVKQDDLDTDNRFDQVILVRDHVRVLVVDGAPNDKVPERSASYFLMHALTPVKEAERAKYYLQTRLVTPRQASPALLASHDLCILADVALQPEPKRRVEHLPADFVEQLGTFVRQGHGLLIFAGDHVAAEPYNRLLGKQQGLLPLLIAGTFRTPAGKALHLDRTSVASPSFWRFREDDYYKGLNDIEIRSVLEPSKPDRAPAPDAQVIMRYNNGWPAVVTRKVDAGEVMLITTAAGPGSEAGTLEPAWTDWPLRLGMYVPFVDVAVSQLLHAQTQNHNFTAGEELRWYPRDRDAGKAFTLVPPDGPRVRLGLPDMTSGRPVVTAKDLTRAGVYRIRGGDEPNGDGDAASSGVPFAVVPDLRESEDLATLTDQQVDDRLGFRPIHLTVGIDPNVPSGAERLNLEWTLWLLAAVLALAVGESALAWFCGRAW
jgi:von Willebrand factor type A domain/Aerotolerance regulator N-terminal